MTRYLVGVKEIHYSYRYVEADNPKDAVEAVNYSGCDEELFPEYECSYSHTDDPDTWLVNQIK